MKLYSKPCFSHFDDINKFTANYFKDFDPHYFIHVRVYKSGKFYFLSSNSHVPKGHLIDCQLPPSGFVQFESIKSGFLLGCDDFVTATTESPKEELALFELYKIKNPLCITKKYQDYFELYLLDLHSETSNSLYINHLGFIEDFFNQIKYQYSDFLLAAEKDPLTVPAEYISRKNNFDIQLSLKKEYNVTKSKGLSHPSILCCDEGMINLTPRESQCLQLLARGFGLKYVARCLGISPRTVETNIEKMRLKSGVSSKESLVELYWNNRTITSKIL